MNHTRIGLGLAAWFLGMLIPFLHHTLLFIAVSDQPTSNVVRTSQSMFKALPWIDWVYLLAMAIVGLILIYSGMKRNMNI